MTDILDQATELEELQRANALKYRKPILTPKGRCYYCLETVDDNRLFCGADCRDGFQLEESAKERNGK